MVKKTDIKILIVEDERSIRKLLKLNLKEAGFRMVTAEDGAEALEIALEIEPDLILLDWMIPEMSGIDFLQLIRKKKKLSQIPVIMLTARSSELDRVMGLEMGADDYITKPFSPKELIARIRALLRRSDRAFHDEILLCGDIKLNVAQRRVSRDHQPIHLGPIEFRLLEHFMRAPGRVFTRGQLLDSVWGRDVYVEERTVDVHIRRLRKAINKPDKDIIRTVRSMGYSIEK